MTIEKKIKKLFRKNIPVIACEFSLEQFALGLRDSIDIKHGNKWHYDIKPPMRFYDQYIFSASPKQEQRIYENMLKRYYGLDHAQIIEKI